MQLLIRWLLADTASGHRQPRTAPTPPDSLPSQWHPPPDEKIKSKLPADHITSLGRIHVDTDTDGVVWLTGSATTQQEIDKVSIAREPEGVKVLHSNIKIKKDD
jgi:BON domain